MCIVNIFERKTLCDMKPTLYVVFWDNIYSNISKIMFLNKVDISKLYLQHCQNSVCILEDFHSEHFASCIFVLLQNIFESEIDFYLIKDDIVRP